MSSTTAFVDCFVCGKRLMDKTHSQTDPESEAWFRAQGWTIGPTRCPDHVGLPDDYPGPVAECDLTHDPEPWLTWGIPGFGSDPTRFDPREGHCRWRSHYREENTNE